MFFETEKLFSPDNGFVLNWLCFLCVFLVGLAAGSLFRIFLPFKKKSPSQRFISICVFLMLAAIIYTLLIFAEKSLFPISQFVSSHVECGFSENSYHLMLILIFLAGTVISLFWKIALLSASSFMQDCLFLHTKFFLQNLARLSRTSG